MAMPQITDYQSASEFLRHYADFRKNLKASWSLQMWASKLRLKNKAPLVRAVNGSRPVSEFLEEKLLSYFDFKNADADYFRVLCAYSRMKAAGFSIDIRTTLNARTARRKHRIRPAPGKWHPVLQSPLSHWLHGMASGLGLPRDHSALMTCFKADVDSDEVRRTVSEMVTAGFLVESSDGKRWKLPENDIMSISAGSIGRREMNLRQLAMMKAAEQKLKQTLDETGEDRVRTFALVLKISRQDLETFNKQIQEAIFELASTYHSHEGEVVLQYQFTGLQVATCDGG